jgi:hypothetical protein
MQQSQAGKRESSSARRIILKLAVILFLGGAGVLMIGSLVQPAAVVAQAVRPAESDAADTRVSPSGTLTRQVFLPLILNRYPASSGFGIQFYNSLSVANGFTRVVESKSGWVRFPVYWSQIEPVNTTPDHYDWTDIDASAQAVRDAGLNAIFTFEENPAWAAIRPGGPVTNTADWQEFVGAVVARYPTIRYWEIYNEPDSIQRFGTKGSVYAAMLSGIYPVIKAANPSARVVLGGLALDWFIDEGGPFDRNFLRDVLINCTGTCFDVANFHYYPYFRGSWEVYGRDIIGKANFVRQTLATYHFTRPLFATETSWPNGSGWGSLEVSARYVPKVYARSQAAGVPVVVWFALVDADLSYSGLLTATGPGSFIPRPSYQALQTLTTLLNGAQYLGVAPVSNPLEGYQFSVFGKRLDLVWYDCPLVKAPPIEGPQDCDNVATWKIPAPRVGVIDKLGTRVIKTDSDDGSVDGKITLSVGSSPIYIDYNP